MPGQQASQPLLDFRQICFTVLFPTVGITKWTHNTDVFCSHSVLISFSINSHITALTYTAEALTNTGQMEADSCSCIAAKLPGNWLVNYTHAPSLLLQKTQFCSDAGSCKLDRKSCSILLTLVHVRLSVSASVQFTVCTHTSELHWRQTNLIYICSSKQIFCTNTSNKQIQVDTVCPHCKGMLLSVKNGTKYVQENKLRFVKLNHLPSDFPKISSNDDDYSK